MTTLSPSDPKPTADAVPDPSVAAGPGPGEPSPGRGDPPSPSSSPVVGTPAAHGRDPRREIPAGLRTATPGGTEGPRPGPVARGLVAVRRAFDSIPASTWDGLLARTPSATPFSQHCIQRSWWQAYGLTAHDQTLVVHDEADPGTVVGIMPLMHRHELEPGDLEGRTTLRHGDPRPLAPVPDSATAVFFGASYHADYATVLAAPDDLAGVCRAVAVFLAAQDRSRWDLIDLRRLRVGDPATAALLHAFEALGDEAGWCVTREPEDVCPVVSLPEGLDFEGFLGTLGKKARHEIRRKVRRAEAAGEVRLEVSEVPADDLEAFIDLHQRRWGADGLFPPTEGGACSRRFFELLFEECTDDGPVELRFLTVGGRRIAAGVTLDDGNTIYYYNAGVDPEARELSPGVVMVARYFEHAIERGRSRVDFMRGNEPYKYEWGAVDEPIERLLVQRTLVEA